MRFLLLRRPAMAAWTASPRTTTPAIATPWLNALVQGQRYASVKAQGAYKQKNKRGIPKKLGAKRTGDQFVVPGNILYKQRGSLWWPGENCIMGRDHTIHAMATGYVKYYRDPKRHPDRKYIGVVFDKADSLPYPEHAERKRRLNLLARPIRAAPTAAAETGISNNNASASGIPSLVTRISPDGQPDRLLKLREDYSYREDNWAIGKLVRTTGLKTHRFRTRKQWFRKRRWTMERMLEGQKKAAAKRKEMGEEEGVGAKNKGGKKGGKKAKKAKAKK